MSNTDCPECVREPDRGTVACPRCGHAATNGTSPRPVPDEVAGWKRYETPPEVLDRARREFDEGEYLAEVREIERTGGVRFEDFIGEVEGQVRTRE